jgi:hypothetical protein
MGKCIFLNLTFDLFYLGTNSIIYLYRDDIFIILYKGENLVKSYVLEEGPNSQMVSIGTSMGEVIIFDLEHSTHVSIDTTNNDLFPFI